MYVAEGVEDGEVNDRIIFPLPSALETYMYYSVCYHGSPYESYHGYLKTLNITMFVMDEGRLSVW